MASTSLLHQGNRLADPLVQLAKLAEVQPDFSSKLMEFNIADLVAGDVEILQVNVGRLCNMTCEHCHVDAGPDRREIMTRETVDDCLELLRRQPSIQTLDLTGGAPEMNPEFRRFVREARELGRHVIDRCNLTILLAKGFEDLADFLYHHQVEIVASLPCYLQENTDAQRGQGAFEKSIKALQLLNRLGYAKGENSPRLTLVYNPVGTGLPPDQTELESAYREQLRARFQIEFSRLFTITNMPISRYLEYLLRSGNFEMYMQKLIAAFNPSAVKGLMCRNTLSVGWDGQLYDCDFNQMLNISCRPFRNIRDVDFSQLAGRPIQTNTHCFGCTAGRGSGCQGAIA